MKKALTVLLSIICVAILFSACSSSENVDAVKDVDVDLTGMSQTMIYAEVNNMCIKPEDYMDKKVKIKGNFSRFETEDGKVYYSCVIPDATACCQQGLEFVTKKEMKDEELPKEGEEIEVVGTFTTYNEGEMKYIQIKDSIMNVVKTDEKK
ncbi:MAG: hypothetical protein IJT65_01805 [Eubacterium sp.]|nr:hypothetical protein [Eubacterium sp.]